MALVFINTLTAMIKVFSLLLSPLATNGSHHCQQHLSELTDLRAISVEEQVLQCIHNPVTYPLLFQGFEKYALAIVSVMIRVQFGEEESDCFTKCQ